ncbi:hypothetical protein IWQ55_006398 [Labrenzia sp. EL_208]|nr:hypothetical protein [Labrenzia sp. EL_132]MBG6233163.1 hypothetical protein [Labrenzia sp. EL_208]
MNFQKKSQFFLPQRKTGRSQVLAMIFFATDQIALEYDDRRVVADVANYVRKTIREKRVELVTIGNADYRGSQNYNRKLGLLRAQSVSSALKNEIGLLKNFSVGTGLSHGESFANQSTSSAKELASDRYVAVWDNIPDFWKPDVSPPVVDTCHRLTRIHLNKFSVEATKGDASSSDESRDAFKGILGKGIDLIVGDVYSKYGSVSFPPHYEKMRSDWRVVTVHIKRTNTVSGVTGGIVTTQDTTIIYHWGPPTKQVTIIHEDFGKDQAIPRHKYRSKFISRESADSDPFTFPPPKEVLAH